MFPLDFEEFCWSQNVDGKIFDMLKECYEKKQSVDDFIHEHLMSLFRKYLIIGGMPAAVASFAQNNSLIDVRQAQEDIKQGSSLLIMCSQRKLSPSPRISLRPRQYRNRSQYYLLPHLPTEPVLQQLAQ